MIKSNKWISIVAIIIAVSFSLGSLLLGGNLHSPKRDHLFKSGSLSEHEISYIRDFFDSGEGDRVKVFLEKHSEFIGDLVEESFLTERNLNLSTPELEYKNSVWKLMNGILDGAHDELVFDYIDALGISARTKQLVVHLDTFLSDQSRLGGGHIANRPRLIQHMSLNARKLSYALDGYKSAQIRELVNWYDSERKVKKASNELDELIISYAWKLSSLIHSRNEEIMSLEIESNLRSASDFVRLLDHENKFVVLNAAELISEFSPKNAVSALRFQVIRKKDQSVKFALLDAIKTYGESREEIAPQLHQMARTTKNIDLRNKILETLNHINGRLVKT